MERDKENFDGWMIDYMAGRLSEEDLQQFHAVNFLCCFHIKYTSHNESIYLKDVFFHYIWGIKHSSHLKYLKISEIIIYAIQTLLLDKI